ncbi:MAG: M20/M25/M40 family metallo-hydrolase [Clostridia bacterium]|nr:M20/M25/M40 family metallo-hydrolase [Clostridia bacterium]
MINKENLYKNLEELVAVPSISGTVDENLGGEKIYEIFSRLNYYKENPQYLRKLEVPGDPLGRKLISAYVKGASNKTVILSGHFDVVDLEDYGELQDIACNIKEITAKADELKLDEEARQDLESGKYIFGRGVADMKFGHALAIELIRHYTEDEKFDGSILYMGVFGEETNSEGMLGAIPHFNALREEYGLDYVAFLLMESYMSEKASLLNKHAVHTAGEGKIMPMFYAVGSSTHSEEPFQGLDPLSILNNIYEELQYSSAFAESKNGRAPEVPVCLKTMDLKDIYSCSTPLSAVSYYNLITLDLDPEGLMNSLREVAEKAIAKALNQRKLRYEEYKAKFDMAPKFIDFKPQIMSYAQLYDMVPNADAVISEIVQREQSKNTDMQDIALMIVDKLYALANIKEPSLVISFIPPYYPDLFRKNEKMLQAIKATINDDFIIDEYYGISDLSYTGLDENKDYASLFTNIVGNGAMYNLPLEEMKKFQVPACVLGSKGKDLHKCSERLEIDFSFNTLPELYIKLMNELIK